ncbi:MAG: hypothetical protein IJZ51_08860 [Ruminiclostridium sp.]|nr:hypothetical protein [Ruminiclostridium sp.]
MKNRLTNTLTTSVFYLVIFFVAGIIVFLFGIANLSDGKGGTSSSGVILMVLGAVVVLFSMLTIRKTLKSVEVTDDLKRLGRKCEGVIIEIVPDFGTAIDGRHPFIARCHVVDNITGETFVVKSHPYFNDLLRLVGQEVNVYVDEFDRTKYFIDIDSLIEEKPYLVGELQSFDYDKRK